MYELIAVFALALIMSYTIMLFMTHIQNRVDRLDRHWGYIELIRMITEEKRAHLADGVSWGEENQYQIDCQRYAFITDDSDYYWITMTDLTNTIEPLSFVVPIWRTKMAL